MKKIALITGVTGQDGALLSEFLLKKIMKFMELKEDHPLLILPELIISIKIPKKQKQTFSYTMAILQMQQI